MEIKRYNPSATCGLTSQQVTERINEGNVNYDTSLSTKSVGRIVFENIFTLFNIINVLLAVAVLYVGSYKNVLFMGIVTANTAIGIFQELRAKLAVDKLSIINRSEINVVRDNSRQTISIHDIVLDDVIELNIGNQIPCDCVVLSGECDANESLLTGESNSVHKTEGDFLLSGSFIVSGRVIAKAELVGENSYASTIFKEARFVKKPNSQILKTIKRIILVCSVLIVPVGSLLFYSQYTLSGNAIDKAVVNTVAAIIGMIPEGLVLLTSTVLAVSVIRLSRQKVLVQELYCIETLARVDVLCLDKTGTITEGSMLVESVITLGENTDDDIKTALGKIVTTLNDDNPTSRAITEYCAYHEDAEATDKYHFSSDKKWSGISTSEETLVLGAAEFTLTGEKLEEFKNAAEDIQDNLRVLTLFRTDAKPQNDGFTGNIELMGIICLKDKIRSNAVETINYFKEQDVQLKIISGDNVRTVSEIAKTVGIDGYDNCIDVSTIENDKELYAAAEKYSVFGRVTPDKKKDLVKALRANNHVVGMTGDGVNDVPALKESDCSIAMANGSDAAKNAAQLVLINSDFSSMPRVVAEGRRSINNIQRSASLFLVKTIFSTILAMIFAFIDCRYPFEPIQMTLISAFTIGIPSFVLALEPNKERIKGNFFLNVISKAFPGALTVVMCIFLVVQAQHAFNLTSFETSTLAVSITAFTNLMLVYLVSYPLNWLRRILIVLMICGLTTGILVFDGFFALSDFTLRLVLILAFLVGFSIILFTALSKVMKLMSSKKSKA